MTYRTARAAMATVFVGALVLIASTPVSGQSSPFAGTWVLDLDQSEFTPAQFAPDAKTVTLAMVGGKLQQTSRTIRNEGRGSVTEVSYTVGFDGSEVTIPASGVRISMKRIDDDTIERIARGDRGQMETSRWTVSDDRTTLTITSQGTDAFGAAYSSTQVFTLDTGD